MSQHCDRAAGQDRWHVGAGKRGLAFVVEDLELQHASTDAARAVDLVEVELGRDAGLLANWCERTGHRTGECDDDRFGAVQCLPSEAAAD